jgi:hypothetical protein
MNAECGMRNEEERIQQPVIHFILQGQAPVHALMESDKDILRALRGDEKNSLPRRKRMARRVSIVG